MVAALRPNDIDLALLVHVLGAMVLLGALVTSTAAGLLAWRGDDAVLRRLGFLTLLAAALPGWIVMRIGAQWVYAKEHLDEIPKDPTWIGIGFGTADVGGLLLLVALIVGAIGLRRGGVLVRASTVLAAVLVLLYLVAVWAMGGKPA